MAAAVGGHRASPGQGPGYATSSGSSWRALTAWSRWHTAHREWSRARGLTRQQLLKVMPVRPPYSARFLVDKGEEELARRLLGPMADEVLGPAREPRGRPRPQRPSLEGS